MRVLVCGSRTWTDRERLYAVLDWFHANEDPIEVVIEGCAPGADRMAEDWARARRIETEHYPADWPKYHRSGYRNPAGAIRNRAMLRLGNPDAVIAFHHPYNSPGTAMMVALARAADIPVYVIRPEEGALDNRPAGPVPAAARTT